MSLFGKHKNALAWSWGLTLLALVICYGLPFVAWDWLQAMEPDGSLVPSPGLAIVQTLCFGAFLLFFILALSGVLERVWFAGVRNYLASSQWDRDWSSPEGFRRLWTALGVRFLLILLTTGVVLFVAVNR